MVNEQQHLNRTYATLLNGISHLLVRNITRHPKKKVSFRLAIEDSNTSPLWKTTISRLLSVTERLWIPPRIRRLTATKQRALRTHHLKQLRTEKKHITLSRVFGCTLAMTTLYLSRIGQPQSSVQTQKQAFRNAVCAQGHVAHITNEPFTSTTHSLSLSSSFSLSVLVAHKTTKPYPASGKCNEITDTTRDVIERIHTASQPRFRVHEIARENLIKSNPFVTFHDAQL